MKKVVVVQAPAKVNLYLDVTGKRADGYHFLDSVMQSVDLCDTVRLSRMDGSGIYISCDRTRVPSDENNLAHIAARRFFKTFRVGRDSALSIELEKRIPLQAGLGGGSSDAAAVLVGLNAMYEIHADRQALCTIGAEVGADVPFCIAGGTMRVKGVGEVLSMLPPLPDCQIVLAKPARGMSTADAYRRYDQLDAPLHPDGTALVKSLDFGDLKTLAQNVGNILQQVCIVPEVGQLRDRMLQYGALGAAMTGSGTAVFGIFDSRSLAKRCMRKLYELSESVFLVRPTARGVMVVRTSDT